jgi:REP element-mobilizing transposase RayT
VQPPESFECHAFQPMLKLVGAPKQNVLTFPEIHPDRPSVNNLWDFLNSDKYMYQRALTHQKMIRNPDDVFLEIKYHFAWNVVCRKPIFDQPGNIIAAISDIFITYDELAGGLVHLLWLAPDHLHLYIESDGEKPIETIAQEIKRISTKSILGQFPDLKKNLQNKKNLWDKAYFAETLS